MVTIGPFKKLKAIHFGRAMWYCTQSKTTYKDPYTLVALSGGGAHENPDGTFSGISPTFGSANLFPTITSAVNYLLTDARDPLPLDFAPPGTPHVPEAEINHVHVIPDRTGVWHVGFWYRTGVGRPFEFIIGYPNSLPE
jgi:hypothetical protein